MREYAAGVNFRAVRAEQAVGPRSIFRFENRLLWRVGRVASRAENFVLLLPDRRGTHPKMTPEVYNAIIDEAHRRGLIVHAHATTLADQKAVVRAGAARGPWT